MMPGSSRRTSDISYDGLLKEGFKRYEPPLAIVAIDNSAEGDDRTGLTMTLRLELERGERTDPDFEVEHSFLLRHAEYLDRGMAEPDKITLLHAWHRHLDGMRMNKKVCSHVFVIERNGVGVGMYQHLQRVVGMEYVLPIMTTGSQNDLPWSEGAKWVFPRAAGLDWFRYILAIERLKLNSTTRGADLMVHELESFTYKGRRPEAIEGAHDDLVMSAALAIWAGTKIIPPIVKAEPVIHPGRAAPGSRARRSPRRLN